MEYDSFDQIDLPNLTVTEPNPAQSLAFRRFSFDQVVRFNAVQAEIIRSYSDAPIAHNYMGRITDFDHFSVGAALDIASWDSYPLGFLEDRVGADAAHQKQFARQGDPDFQAFDHELYRAVGRGRWWVMEQQPGPVNWASYNPAPLSGMVRLWTWEAFAHGTEAVCYFRWRQAPFAQEQMHAGLLRPDSVDAPGLAELQEVASELTDSEQVDLAQSRVAILFDYDAGFGWAVQPHGAGLSYFGLVFDFYRALRRLGLSIDFLPPTTRDFSGYDMIATPGMLHMPDDLKGALAASGAEIFLGPRSAARDEDMAIPVPLPPAFEGLDVTVTAVQSMRPDMPLELACGRHFIGYAEETDGPAEVVQRCADGAVALWRQHRLNYLTGWPDREAWHNLLHDICSRAGLSLLDLPAGVRCRDTATERFWFNYDSVPHVVDGLQIPGAAVLRQPSDGLSQS